MKKTITVSLLLASALSAADGSWIIAPKYGSLESENRYKAVTTIPAMGNMVVDSMDENRNVKHNMVGLMAGKDNGDYRYYLDYDRFTYKKDPNKFGDKDVNGWLMTANIDYMYPVYDRVRVFGGGALIVAGTKPEGMTSNPALAIGANVGVTADVYKVSDKQSIFFEGGYRYIKTHVKSTETTSYAAGTSTDIEVITTTLKGWYFSLGYKF
jgi:hypothetical protein